MTDTNKILDKIRKCLALSTSSNEHEAEVALRHARKLMEAHGLTEQDVAAAEAKEIYVKASVKRCPPIWEALLSSQIANAFGCRVFFAGSRRQTSGQWCFIGCGASPDVAQYAFTVLHRQAKRAREAHIKGHLKRCSTNKTRRADLFSEGWVRAVAGKITEFCGTEMQSTAIDAYVAKHYPEVNDLKMNNRNKGRTLGLKEYDDYLAGQQSGKDAQLNHAVSGSDQQQLSLV